MKIFTLWANNQPYDLDGPTFAKMSKKCGKLMSEGKTQGDLKLRVRNDTITAFIAACQLQPFKVTKSNAFELQAAASEWEVATLSKFVKDYINSKKLTPLGDVDPVAQLLKNCAKKNYLETDIIAVANIVNQALDDPRFLEAPPEMIFQILQLADQNEINNQQLVNFVITLFNANPQTASPLISLIDFSILSKDQTDGIFQCPEIHEQNVNFFIAWALSNLRKKADRERVHVDSSHFSEISVMNEVVTKGQNKAADKLKEEHDDQLKKLKERCQRQEEEIRQLEKETEFQQNTLQRKIKEHGQKLKQLENEIAKIVNFTNEYENMVNNFPTILRGEVDQEIQPINRQIAEKMAEVAERNNQELHKIQDEYDQPVEDEKQKTEGMQEDVSQRIKKVSNETARISDLKASLAIKMVKDKMQYGKHIREKERKFASFETRNGFWGVSAAQAKEAAQHLKEISTRLQNLCPLDGFE